MPSDSPAPHRRYDPLRGRWVLVSPGRDRRPWSGEPDAPARRSVTRHDPTCPLCPGNERPGGGRNPDYAGPYVFTNDFPALRPGHQDRDDQDRDRWRSPNVELVPSDRVPSELRRAELGRAELLRAESETGTCRVLCFGPRHDTHLAAMSDTELRAVVDTWVAQTVELSRDWRWVQVFENRGEAMGASNPHPHGQIWASSSLPDEPAAEDDRQRDYLRQHGRRLLVDYAELELAAGERVVAVNSDWLAVVPFWAVWPFETLVVPQRPVAGLPELDDSLRTSLVGMLRTLLAAYDGLFGVPFPYSMGWHGAPGPGPTGGDQRQRQDTAHWQLHAHFYPPLLRSATVRKFMVGYEMLAEAQRDITPEAAAARLREHLPTSSRGHGAIVAGLRRSAITSDRPKGVVVTGAVSTGTAAARAVAAFERSHGVRPGYLVRSPGRVNLIGEHTDYNDGLCLPVAIDLEVCLAFSPGSTGDGAVVEVVSEQQDAPAVVRLPPPSPPEPGPPLRATAAQDGWAGYVEGVVVMLAAAAADDGVVERGWHATVASDVPPGAGLSSSAALELAVARACSSVWELPWEPVEAAKLAQRAENGWVGAATGLLDQLACAGGVAGHALAVDLRDLTTSVVAVPSSVVVAVFDTGTRRELVTSAYAERRADCERAAAGLGVASLREIGDELPADAARRLDPVALRRARHVVTDNRRVRELAEALRQGDLPQAGAVLVDGHRSVRDDFEVCGLEQDSAVAACLESPGCYGARMTGGGFAGCVVALVDVAAATTFAVAASRAYRAKTGRNGQVHLCAPVAGTSLVPNP